MRFVEWSPAGFKIGLNRKPMSAFPDGQQSKAPRSVCLLSNNTAIREAWGSLNHKFDLVCLTRISMPSFL